MLTFDMVMHSVLLLLDYFAMRAYKLTVSILKIFGRCGRIHAKVIAISNEYSQFFQTRCSKPNKASSIPQDMGPE